MNGTYRKLLLQEVGKRVGGASRLQEQRALPVADEQVAAASMRRSFVRWIESSDPTEGPRLVTREFGVKDPDGSNDD